MPEIFSSVESQSQEAYREQTLSLLVLDGESVLQSLATGSSAAGFDPSLGRRSTEHFGSWYVEPLGQAFEPALLM